MFQNAHAVGSPMGSEEKEPTSAVQDHLETVEQSNMESQSITSHQSSSSGEHFDGESFDELEAMKEEMKERLDKLDK